MLGNDYTLYYKSNKFLKIFFIHFLLISSLIIVITITKEIVCKNGGRSNVRNRPFISTYYVVAITFHILDCFIIIPRNILHVLCIPCIIFS